MNDINNKIEARVMGNIKSGKVKLRSKYVFLAEKLGLGSAVILSLLLSVLFFNLVLFYLKASDNLAYLSFGSLGFFAFLESFPYLLVVSFIILVFIVGYLFKKTEIAYQKPFGYLAVGLMFFILLTGSGLAFTNIAEEIERQAFEARSFGFLFHPFLQKGTEDHQYGIVGRIVEVGKNYARVQTTRTVESLDFSGVTNLNNIRLAEGDFIMVIGERGCGGFRATSLHLIDPSDMPMIRRGIHRRFGTDKAFFNARTCGLREDPPFVSTTATCH